MKKIEKLEELVNQIETEMDFDKAVSDFNSAANLVKELLADLSTKQGKFYEVINGMETEEDAVFD